MSDLELYNNNIIVLSNDSIIKVIKDDDTYYYGYDILTEQFKKVFKIQSIQINKTIISLLNSEVLRTKLALVLSDGNIPKTCGLLNISERTLYRIKREHFDLEEKK